MERVRKGDTHAFEHLVERFWKRTLLYARNLTGDQDGALDVTQEAFARLWKKRAEWEPSGSVRNWLLRTARNMVLSEQRKLRVRSAWTAQAPEEAGALPPTPLQDLERTELRQAIIEAVQRLPARRREAFTLFHLQGLSYRETAEIMMVREQTVANYLQAALGDLRVSLAPFFPAAGSPGPAEESRQDEAR
jgi:RNA polymerase sigma-70 factor, ECF subfamily